MTAAVRLLIEIRILIEGVLVFLLLILLPQFLFKVHGDRERWGHIPRISDLFVPRTEENAQIITMVHDVVERGGWHRIPTAFDTYTIIFMTAAGERIRMRASRRVYDSLHYPAHGVLKRRGEWFLSFSPEE